MADVQKSLLIQHSAQRMYNLVTDVAKYPEFLPWCGGVEIFQSTPELMEAKININFKGVKQYFHTKNIQKSPTNIDMTFVSGPFKKFEGQWIFTPLADDACKIEFSLRYEFSNFVLDKLIGPVFSVIANTFVNSFVKRADDLYGE
ncbi:ubiquinone-binding protein [Polynucleobacter sp. SHI8]|uniref:type II toxin-antitoxin system RatA family toxin n=1 Tax=unclassified Polynucleobacter TaxID=2640945 RepID=UPI0024937690|nr:MULTISPECIES: type II toxin-antitoxin system RatA family toxin [unclassified Polynucleobacter]BDW11148.1 ubiquinone-binding protein [Polynucleobacter sp. SHI2]BDW13594.1 ubiquinone-binding protein [Polynucleobacter sp. SHI8]